MKTTITINVATWQRLMKFKKKPKDNFDEIIAIALDCLEGKR